MLQKIDLEGNNSQGYIERMELTSQPSKEAKIAIVSGVILLRILVGFQPHSGQDDYHGNKAAYGGDFEAQRHWMELTFHLPLSEWYWYDPQYWGLDYPPLSAYQSWLCGWFLHHIIPESVALESSRRFEDPVHKAAMRFSVIVFDMLIYATAVWYITRPNTTKKHSWESLGSFGIAMAQPAILLIDHGHFQYNTAALGLALWSFHLCTMPNFLHCIIGSVCFCAALSFKQMTLYYAPAIFFYLLGRCYSSNKFLLSRFLALAGTVVLTFLIIWWPFVAYGPQGTTALQRLVHVIRRIIPVQRGLFEGKVSNLWCALSVKPFRIRERLPAALQFPSSLLLTFGLSSPSCYTLFRMGRQKLSGSQQTVLLWGASSCALAFFLASFQVHEKSILLVLAPLSLVDDPGLANWFTFVSVWSLWPLLVLDRLQIAYVCMVIIFASLLRLRYEIGLIPKRQQSNDFFQQIPILVILRYISVMIMLGLHLSEVAFVVPPHLPDLFPVLWSVTGCGFFLFTWTATCWHLYCRSGSKLKAD